MTDYEKILEIHETHLSQNVQKVTYFLKICQGIGKIHQISSQ